MTQRLDLGVNNSMDSSTSHTICHPTFSDEPKHPRANHDTTTTNDGDAGLQTKCLVRENLHIRRVVCACEDTNPLSGQTLNEQYYNLAMEVSEQQAFEI